MSEWNRAMEKLIRANRLKKRIKLPVIQSFMPEVEILWLVEDEIYTTKEYWSGMPLDMDLRKIMCENSFKDHTDHHWLNPDPWVVPIIFHNGQPAISYVRMDEL
jgi:hypothetical protein